jgi:hypothetical protein
MYSQQKNIMAATTIRNSRLEGRVCIPKGLGLDGRGSIPVRGQQIFLYSTRFRTKLRSTLSLIHQVPRGFFYRGGGKAVGE